MAEALENEQQNASSSDELDFSSMIQEMMNMWMSMISQFMNMFFGGISGSQGSQNDATVGDEAGKDEVSDLDGDGIVDSKDDDIDNDGIINTEDEDVDGDGIIDTEDDDLDNDGIVDSEEINDSPEVDDELNTPTPTGDYYDGGNNGGNSGGVTTASPEEESSKTPTDKDESPNLALQTKLSDLDKLKAELEATPEDNVNYRQELQQQINDLEKEIQGMSLLDSSQLTESPKPTEPPKKKPTVDGEKSSYTGDERWIGEHFDLK